MAAGHIVFAYHFFASGLNLIRDDPASGSVECNSAEGALMT
jgi:hypothetical protein